MGRLILHLNFSLTLVMWMSTTMSHGCISTPSCARDVIIKFRLLPLQAEVTISKLTEERRLTIQERENLQQELVTPLTASFLFLLFFVIMSRITAINPNDMFHKLPLVCCTLTLQFHIAYTCQQEMKWVWVWDSCRIPLLCFEYETVVLIDLILFLFFIFNFLSRLLYLKKKKFKNI